MTMPPMALEPAVELTAGWRAWGRVVALLAAVTFAISTALSALDSLNITTPEAHVNLAAPFPDRILTILQNQSARFPWVLAATLLAVVSLAALAALGPVLRRLIGAEDPRGSLVSGAFLFGGLIGVAGELAFIGGQAVASDTSYCDCDFADPQLIARIGVLDLVSSIQTWMLAGLLVGFGIGLVALAMLVGHPWTTRGWRLLSGVLGVLMLVVAVLLVGFPPLANAMRWDVDPNLVTGVPSLVVLLVLVPWWALWLRRLLASEPRPA
jgi:hypothetical protein